MHMHMHTCVHTCTCTHAHAYVARGVFCACTCTCTHGHTRGVSCSLSQASIHRPWHPQAIVSQAIASQAIAFTGHSIHRPSSIHSSLPQAAPRERSPLSMDPTCTCTCSHTRICMYAYALSMDPTCSHTRICMYAYDHAYMRTHARMHYACTQAASSTRRASNLSSRRQSAPCLPTSSPER